MCAYVGTKRLFTLNIQQRSRSGVIVYHVHLDMSPSTRRTTSHVLASPERREAVREIAWGRERPKKDHSFFRILLPLLIFFFSLGFLFNPNFIKNKQR